MTWLDDITLQTVLVHLTDNGPSIKGLKAAVHDDCLVLRDPLVLEESGSTLLDGECVIPRERVLFMQLVPGDAS